MCECWMQSQVLFRDQLPPPLRQLAGDLGQKPQQLTGSYFVTLVFEVVDQTQVTSRSL